MITNQRLQFSLTRKPPPRLLKRSLLALKFVKVNSFLVLPTFLPLSTILLFTLLIFLVVKLSLVSLVVCKLRLIVMNLLPTLPCWPLNKLLPSVRNSVSMLSTSSLELLVVLVLRLPVLVDKPLSVPLPVPV
ncbi:40S ribosomal protein S14 [Rhizopus delemar RA 99-880]|uniref:40S ribosomal protein S14 n=1 Tax=Rhizopus delemar (strain RA 99-880 / ATCC MYA-4621 / FGSC 9543 / NRRL 43880) TaxID=246409 RepID=I1CHK1_RHIO9|nr:40S ribosomal protein S14 [Rhizopus delemar RA 99-880]|eukprot:EIE87931.1 40S ribosomal protein S14 [Rhizopus delemar RA 99-880]